MHQIVKRSLFSLLCLFLLINFGALRPQKAQAAGEALMISPSLIEEIVQPGETLTKTVHVVNESSSARRIYPIIKDFVPNGEDGTPRLIEPGSQEGSFLSSYLNVANTDGILIGPGNSYDFSFTITMPATAGPGGYYSAMVFGTKADDLHISSQDKGAASAISQQAGCLLLVKIPGGANEKAEVRDFSTDKTFFGTPYKVNFKTRIENLGNVHVSPRGVISITNMLSREVATLKVNDHSGSILPKSIRKFDNDWQDKLGFGRYKAQMALSYGTPASAGGNGKQSLVAETFFWIIPWKIVIPVIIGLLIFLTLSYLSLKSYKDRAIKKALRSVGAGANGVRRVSKNSRANQVSNGHLNLLLLAILSLVGLLILLVGLLLFA